MRHVPSFPLTQPSLGAVSAADKRQRDREYQNMGEGGRPHGPSQSRYETTVSQQLPLLRAWRNSQV